MIKKECDVACQLIEGGGGIFDVTVDGELIFSKQAQGDRFPEHEEILDLLNARRA